MLVPLVAFSQNIQDYYVKIKEGIDLGNIQKSISPDETITITKSTTIDISTYTTGLYNIILVCDGEVQNSKSLIKQ